MTIDLNCDMGEGMETDAAIMPFISSANIACGYHAGDKDTIRKTIALCLQNNVAVGAHPGFPDKSNFGRTPMLLSSEDLFQIIEEQLEIIQSCCNEMGATLHHVKPHGALYNMAIKDNEISAVIAKAVKDFNPKLIYYGLSGSCMIEEAKQLFLQTANEVFADRTYQQDGSLTPRSEKNAMIENSEQALTQVLEMLEHSRVTTLDGSRMPIVAESVCIHGDNPNSLALAKFISEGLKYKRYSIQSPSYK